MLFVSIAAIVAVTMVHDSSSSSSVPAPNPILASSFEDVLHNEGIWNVSADGGSEVCRELRHGSHLFPIVASLQSVYTLNEHDAGFVIGAATVAFCPEYVAQVKAEAIAAG